MSSATPHQHREVGACGSNGGACSRAWRTRRQFVEHVEGDGACAVGTNLVQVQPDLDLEPKSKVVAHEQLYKFHLGDMVIRAVD